MRLTILYYLLLLSVPCAQEEAKQAKAVFIAKAGREKRNLERNKARSLTKEEIERLAQLDLKRVVRTESLTMFFLFIYFFCSFLFTVSLHDALHYLFF
jgi:hypothetical protein